MNSKSCMLFMIFITIADGVAYAEANPMSLYKKAIQAEVTASGSKLNNYKQNYDSLDALYKKYYDAKSNQQSTANKLLTGAAVGTVGGGLKMALQGAAEQSADAAAESDMSMYLNSFRCDYGAGKNVMGGDMNVELPGINALTPLFSEYVALASDLKARKESLGLSPGIESELILDAANTGLYQNASLGITDGHYASWARALMNPDGEDAAEIAEMQKKSKDTKTAGIAMAAVGAVGSAVANAAMNKNAPKNNADNVNKEYKDTLGKTSADQLAKDRAECEKQKGTKIWQDNKCIDDPEYLKSLKKDECKSKGSDFIWDDAQGCIANPDKVKCDAGAPETVWENGKCVDKKKNCEDSGNEWNATDGKCERKKSAPIASLNATMPGIEQPELMKRNTVSQPVVKDYELHEVPYTIQFVAYGTGDAKTKAEKLATEVRRVYTDKNIVVKSEGGLYKVQMTGVEDTRKVNEIIKTLEGNTELCSIAGFKDQKHALVKVEGEKDKQIPFNCI